MVHLIGMWWPPHESIGAALHAALFLGLASGTLYFFLQSLLEGPGFVPFGWKPVSWKASFSNISIHGWILWKDYNILYHVVIDITLVVKYFICVNGIKLLLTFFYVIFLFIGLV